MKMWHSNLKLILLLPVIYVCATPLSNESWDGINNITDLNQRVSCWPPRSLPPGFHCKQALDEFLSGLRPLELYFISSWRPLSENVIRVPKVVRSGICEFKIYLQKGGYPNQYPVTRWRLDALGEAILNTCVADERHSNGGLIWLDIETSGQRNAFIMEFFPKRGIENQTILEATGAVLR